MAIGALISRETDLDRGVTLERLDRLFATGDRGAHTFEIAVTASGAPVDLSGQSVTAYFIRAAKSPDDPVQTVFMTGSARGNVVRVTLDAACYDAPAHFTLIVKAGGEDATAAVFWADGYVTRSRTDAIVDPGHEIPSLEELLALIDSLRETTGEALEAIRRAEQGEATREAAEKTRETAETAREKAETARKAAETAREKAETTRASAETARERAETARDTAERDRAAAEARREKAELWREEAEDERAREHELAMALTQEAAQNASDAAAFIADLTVDASGVGPGAGTRAAASGVDGHLHIHFDIEKGEKGEKGDTGATGATGPMGPTGPTGAQGPQGERGATGAQGEPGVRGEKGETGAQGEPGERGPRGEKGEQGEKGEKGDRGDSGVTVPISGCFTLSGDEDGNLWAICGDADNPPAFSVEDGDIYLIISDEA